MPAEYSVPNIIAQARADYPDTPGGKVQTLDAARLNAVLDKIDGAVVQKRRALYRRLWHEMRACCHPRRGLTFTETLTLLAHYKLIDDNESLGYAH
jgi:hypothetical protein